MTVSASACVKCGHDPAAVVLRSWEFLVAKAPKSMNARIVNAGATAGIYKRERIAWGWELRIARLGNGITKATTRRRVTLTRVFTGRQRELDPDNLSGGMKLIVDSIVLEGLLLGDTAALAEIHYQQRRAPVPGLHVVIEDIA